MRVFSHLEPDDDFDMEVASLVASVRERGCFDVPAVQPICVFEPKVEPIRKWRCSSADRPRTPKYLQSNYDQRIYGNE